MSNPSSGFAGGGGGVFLVGKKFSSIQEFKPPSNYNTESGGDESKQQSFDYQSITIASIKDEQQSQHNQLLSENLIEISAENLTFIANTKVGNWFSWCQSCKHGGHIKHLIEWFRLNQKCPYLHCKCKCTSIDLDY